ncbi:MAG: FtsX-like permease family protein [bacterium]|nr:FtsX-like permease family protein [bacterium]
MNRINNKIPAIARWILSRFRDRIRHESLIGDFDEIFHAMEKKDNLSKARFWYGFQVVKALPSFISNSVQRSITMFRNYLKIAFRNLFRYKSFSLINISGLAISMACAFLIFLWVQDEMSYDKFHENADEIYNVMLDTKTYGIWGTTPIPLGPVLMNDYPEIANSSRLRQFNGVFKKEDSISRERGYFVDPEFFDMFSFPLVEGDPQNVFSELYSIVITEDLASKYFGDDNPIGQTININNRRDYVVKGIIENTPRNSHLRFSFLVPFEIFKRNDNDPENFGRFQVLTYIQLNKDAEITELEPKVVSVINDRSAHSNIDLILHPLTRIHLYDVEGGGLITYVYIFSMIAVFILLIASINSMNMSTARSMSRAKEIGIRKITGAFRLDLIKQFLGEHLLYSFLALVIAIVVAVFCLPVFKNLIGKDLNVGQFFSIEYIIGIVLIGGLTGIISSSYPAYFLSSIRPLRLLRGAFLPTVKSEKNSGFRNTLVVFQFSISVFLIVSTILISRQMGLINTKDLGYEKKNVAYFLLRGNTGRQFDSFKTELLKQNGIENVTIVSEPPVEIGRVKTGWNWEGKPADLDPPWPHLMVGFDFFDTFDMEIVQGRAFSKDFPTDASEAYIINESALKIIGDESPVGKSFAMAKRDGWKEGRIIGVVKDFHFKSLHNDIQPLVIDIYPEMYFACVKMQDDDIASTLSNIEQVWKNFEPTMPFSYTFVDDYYNSMYMNEEMTRKILGYFAVLALFISCLGLFSLTSYMVEQRKKEVGIRKAMGATAANIARLVSNEFLILIIIANCIAWPVTYFSVRYWLRDFAYKVGIDMSIFLAALVVSIGIATATILYQVIKASMANPVDSIRHE